MVRFPGVGEPPTTGGLLRGGAQCVHCGRGSLRASGPRGGRGRHGERECNSSARTPVWPGAAETRSGAAFPEVGRIAPDAGVAQGAPRCRSLRHSHVRQATNLNHGIMKTPPAGTVVPCRTSH
jgi:hypothetical protein